MNEFIIETKKLTIKYGEQYAVKNLNLHVPKGKIYGLLGRNGAGKTTTMKMIMNLIKPTSGEIFLFGENIQKNKRNIYSRIGSVIETPGFYSNLTAYENLLILSKLRGVHKPDAIKCALEKMGLENEKQKKVSEYSLGMNQRLGIAAAIMHEPELLILDEPTNGLDPIGIREMRNLLLKICEEKNVTIVISSHILSEIEQLVDYVGIINKGELIQEISMEQLEKVNRNYIKIHVSSVSTTLPILEKKFGITDYKVIDDETLYLFDVTCDMTKINRTLVENGIGVSLISPCESNLEDYFANLIGGNEIA